MKNKTNYKKENYPNFCVINGQGLRVRSGYANGECRVIDCLNEIIGRFKLQFKPITNLNEKCYTKI